MYSSFIRGITAAFAFVAVLWVLGKYILPVSVPFLLALLLALAAEPLVNVFHRRLKFHRTAATGIGVSIALLLAALGATALGALALRELKSMTDMVPQLAQTAADGLQNAQIFLKDLVHQAPENLRPSLENGVERLFSDGSKVIDQAGAGLIDTATGIVKALPDSFLAFGTWIMASFMISARLPMLRKLLRKHLPSQWHTAVMPTLRRTKKHLQGWLFAQFKLIGLTFVVLCLGLLVLRIPYAPIWALLIALLDALPILGTGTVLIPWSVLCFLQGDPPRGIGLALIWLTAALLRSVLEPRLVGKQLGLDPLITLGAMYTGYRLWGIWGMLLMPLIAVTVASFFIGNGKS